jgi:hypothetical protein
VRLKFPSHIGVWRLPEAGAIHCGRQHGVHCECVLGLRQIGSKQLAFFLNRGRVDMDRRTFLRALLPVPVAVPVAAKAIVNASAQRAASAVVLRPFAPLHIDAAELTSSMRSSPIYSR